MARGRTFDVEVRGLDELRRRLESRRLLSPVRKEIIEEAGKAGKAKAIEAAKPHAADKGSLGRAVRLRVEDGGNKAIVDVAPQVAGIAFVIEEGRRPGRAPPLRVLKAWADSHGIPTPPRELQQAIRAQGTRGIHFMRQAQEEAEKVVRGQVPAAERGVERAFG